MRLWSRLTRSAPLGATDPALPMGALVVGTLFLFVTFTTSLMGGATGYLLTYTPLALGCLILLNALDPPRRPGVPRLVFLMVCLAVFLASLSINGLQFAVVFTVYVAMFLTIPLEPMIRNLPTFAFCAMLLNMAIYLTEIVLVGQLGIPFDATIFNYGGAGREEVSTTWGFARFSGHQAEPGYYASNLAVLAILSLLDGRRPSWLHWVAVLTMAMTLSLSSMIMAAILVLSLILSNRMGVMGVLSSIAGLTVASVAFLYLAEVLGIQIFEYLYYRLQVRGGTDGSIYVKTLLAQDLQTRQGWEAVFGNRHQDCDYCIYARSLGLGFYMLFHGGVIGGLALAAVAATAVIRLGRRGLALTFILVLMRAEFFFPQAVFIILVVTTMTKVRQDAPRSTQSAGPLALNPRWPA